MRIAVIPALNEETSVAAVVASVLPHVAGAIVVDDGSVDGTARAARQAGATVYRHFINRGVGAATATGLRAALRAGADFIVTLDADGQHAPCHIDAVLAPVESDEADFVVGNRMHRPAGMPASRQAANRLANLCTLALFGVRVSDSQSGFRGFTRQAAAALEIRTTGYECCSEIIADMAARGFRIKEVPVPAIYSDYSLSKGQNFSTGLGTLARLVIRKIHGSR